MDDHSSTLDKAAVGKLKFCKSAPTVRPVFFLGECSLWTA